jgi:large subunit ribosomal protein L29
MARSELASMERSELEDRLVEARRELFNLRFQKATGQLDNTARVRHVRKEVARVLTYMRQQDLGIEEPEAGFVAPVGDAEPEEEVEEARAPVRRRRPRRDAAEAAEETEGAASPVADGERLSAEVESGTGDAAADEAKTEEEA